MLHSAGPLNAASSHCTCCLLQGPSPLSDNLLFMAQRSCSVNEWREREGKAGPGGVSCSCNSRGMNITIKIEEEGILRQKSKSVSEHTHKKWIYIVCSPEVTSKAAWERQKARWARNQKSSLWFPCLRPWISHIPFLGLRESDLISVF